MKAWKPKNDAVDADAAWVAAARAGDASAYEKLVSRHDQRVFRLALNITRNHEDAEEVVQDTFVRAHAHLDSFQGDSKFSTWLTRIAINQALMKLRRRRPEMKPLDEPADAEGALPREIADWGPNPEQRYSQEELREILNRAIAGLGPAQRIVFELRDVEEMSILETAQALKLSVTAVKSRLLRARLELRERLNRYFRLPPALNPSLNAGARIAAQV